MRVLLDECLPARLRRELPGHDVLTVPQAGWAGITNGRLLRLIGASALHDVFITMDRSLPHEQHLVGLSFAIIILRAPSNRLEDTRPLLPELLRRLADCQPGCVYRIPAAP